jgi:anti-sigma factor RsiW
MNHNDSLHDDALFDRLVDGELTGEERRRLLESLDTRPEGWRRCALAFLEAQSWREELGQVARAAHPLDDSPEKPTVTPSTSVSSQPKTSRWIAAQLRPAS